jgi:hypothetical protein
MIPTRVRSLTFGNPVHPLQGERVESRPDEHRRNGWFGRGRDFVMDPNRLEESRQEKYRLFEEVSPIRHLTKDDAPSLLIYTNTMETRITSQNIGIHHPRFRQGSQGKHGCPGH